MWEIVEEDNEIKFYLTVLRAFPSNYTMAIAQYGDLEEIERNDGFTLVLDNLKNPVKVVGLAASQYASSDVHQRLKSKKLETDSSQKIKIVKATLENNVNFPKNGFQYNDRTYHPERSPMWIIRIAWHSKPRFFSCVDAELLTQLTPEQRLFVQEKLKDGRVHAAGIEKSKAAGVGIVPAKCVYIDAHKQQQTSSYKIKMIDNVRILGREIEVTEAGEKLFLFDGIGPGH